MSYAELLQNREKNRHKYCQNFSDSKENYSITQYGERYNLYQHIQNAREDTEIIPTLEKYGMAKGMEKLKRYNPEDAAKYYGDFSQLSDFRNLMDKSKKADEMWKGLPLEIRQQFGNSQREFMEKGGAWLKKQHEEYIAKQQPVEETKTTEVKGAENVG